MGLGAFVMALVLLTVRFGTYSDELFVTPVEDAIFDVAFVVADAEGKQTKPPAIKSKQALDCVLLPDQVAAPRPVPARCGSCRNRPVPPPGIRRAPRAFPHSLWWPRQETPPVRPTNVDISRLHSDPSLETQLGQDLPDGNPSTTPCDRGFR